MIALSTAFGGATPNWTDGTLTPGGTFIRAPHMNELRMATEYVRRGFMTFPIYWCSGLFSILPDSSWLGEFIANNGDDELRNVGYGFLTIPGSSPTLGIANATVLSGYIEVAADGDCTAEVHHCLRPIDRVNLLASWNEYDQTLGGSWGTPGGIGSGDSTSIGSVALTAGVPGRITGGGVTSALQAMVNGAEQNFLIRRGDTGWETIHVSATAAIEFDLNAPPN
jgi:hypothetical protein